MSEHDSEHDLGTRAVDCTQAALSGRSALGEEIHLAAQRDYPVLFSGSPDAAVELACPLDRQSPLPHGTLGVVDCRQQGAVGAIAFLRAARARAGHESRAIVLFQEVHTLSQADQALLEQHLEETRLLPNPMIRIVCSSSAELWERVCEGTFRERLFYRLNVIHVVIPIDR